MGFSCWSNPTPLRLSLSKPARDGSFKRGAFDMLRLSGY